MKAILATIALSAAALAAPAQAQYQNCHAIELEIMTIGLLKEAGAPKRDVMELIQMDQVRSSEQKGLAMMIANSMYRPGFMKGMNAMAFASYMFKDCQADVAAQRAKNKRHYDAITQKLKDEARKKANDAKEQAERRYAPTLIPPIPLP